MLTKIIYILHAQLLAAHNSLISRDWALSLLWFYAQLLAAHNVLYAVDACALKAMRI